MAMVRVSLAACLMMLSLSAAGQFFSDYWGVPLPSSGQRPLLIGSYEQLRAFYRDPLMSAPDKRLGFVSRLAIDPESFDLEQMAFQNDPGELVALQRTQLEAGLLANGAPLSGFDGRVVIWAHASADGRLASETALGRYDGLTEVRRFGLRLGEFFQRTGIRPRQIDLMTCCGAENTPSFADGLAAAGIQNFRLRAVDGRIMRGTQQGSDGVQQWLFFRDDVDGHAVQSGRVRAADFFATGAIPDDAYMWVLDLQVGQPATSSCPALATEAPTSAGSH